MGMFTISHLFAGNEEHTVKTDVSLSTEASGTASASPAVPSQEVSQSEQKSGVSPVLVKYKEYL